MKTPKYWWKVLDELRSNARMPLTEVSWNTGLPVSTVHDQLKKQRKKYRFAVLADFRKLGMAVWALLFFAQGEKARNLVAPFLKGHANVNNLYLMRDEFVVEVVFRTEEEYSCFVAQLHHDYDIPGAHRMDIGEPVKREACKLEELKSGELAESAGRGC